MKIKRISDAVVRSFKMRLCHISDTHGGFPKLYGKYDCVVHSGDFFPNSHHVRAGNKIQEAAYQLEWLKGKISEMKPWLQGHPFLYVLGNHDFLHPGLMEYTLQSEGIKAIDLTDKIVTHEGVNFYGFPYVPAINGMWNYERETPEMQEEADKMVAQINVKYTDVLVCHAPIYKCLDLSYGNQVLGSNVIANTIDYKINNDMMPTTYLHGHIHESSGISIRKNMLVSNAAVTRHIIEV